MGSILIDKFGTGETMFIMVFTIHRYIFRDLLKTFILATVILSTVLGLGFMLRPLREYSVNPADVPSLILCTLPITLTMVIPIAALLSATLNYGRLAVDNEINACRSSGISLPTLIYPALALALLVGMATLLLAFHVIPTFAGKFEQIIKADAEATIFRNIQKKGNLGRLANNIFVHADYAIAEQHRLTGVAVIKRDRDKIDFTLTAEQVVLHFPQAQDKNHILLYLYNPEMIVDNNTANIGNPFIFTVNLPPMFRDNIQFKKLSELQAIREDMTLFEPLRDILNEIRRQIMVENFFNRCDQQLRNYPHYIELKRGPDLVRIYGQGCALRTSSKEPDKKTRGKNRTARLQGINDSDIKVTYFYSTGSGTAVKNYQAKQGQISVTELAERPSLVLKLEEVQWNYKQNDFKYHLDRYDVANISLPEEIFIEAQMVTLDQLLAMPAKSVAGASAYLQYLYQKIKRDAGRLGVEIQVELHSRLAFGINCVVLVLLGAALGIIFHSGHLLTAFGVSFIPTALCLITIFTGKHIAEQEGVSNTVGIAFLWSGVVLAAVANIIIYRKLLKY